jgi:hypothetical protein
MEGGRGGGVGADIDCRPRSLCHTAAAVAGCNDVREGGREGGREGEHMCNMDEWSSHTGESFLLCGSGREH